MPQHRQELDGAAVPDANEEHLIYQTLVGTWPVGSLDDEGRTKLRRTGSSAISRRRCTRRSCTRAGSTPTRNTTKRWRRLCRRILADRQSAVRQDLDAFARSIADAGFVNSLAQTLIKIAAPGVPDFYQGTEFWDFNLVDPDNRRPVDFRRRQETLAWLTAEAREGSRPISPASCCADGPTSGSRCSSSGGRLHFADTNIDLFRGDYLPLSATGPRQDNTCVFARVADWKWALSIVPRLALEATQKFIEPRNGSKAEGSKFAGSAWPPGHWWRRNRTCPAPGSANALATRHHGRHSGRSETHGFSRPVA